MCYTWHAICTFIVVLYFTLFISSFHWNELMQSRGVHLSVFPSVCLSVNFVQIASSTTNMTGSRPNLHTMVPRRAHIQDVLKVKVKVKGHVIWTLFWRHKNRFFYHKYDWIANKLAHDGPHMGLHPGCAQGQGQRSWYGHFSDYTKIASSTTNITGLPPNLHMMVPWRARFQVVLKVKGHVIRTLVISRKSLLLPQTWMDRHQTYTRWSPHGPASRLCSRSRWRSKVTWYGHFSDYTKIASFTTNMTRSPPNLHTMVPRRACIQDVLKVKVKDHVIRALLWCHEMFAIQYLLTFCLYMHSLYEAPLHSPSSTSVRCNVYIMEWATPSLTVCLCDLLRICVVMQFCPFDIYDIRDVNLAAPNLVKIFFIVFFWLLGKIMFLRLRLYGRHFELHHFQNLTILRSKLCALVWWNKKLSYRLETGRQQCISL